MRGPTTPFARSLGVLSQASPCEPFTFEMPVRAQPETPGLTARHSRIAALVDLAARVVVVALLVAVVRSACSCVPPEPPHREAPSRSATPSAGQVSRGRAQQLREREAVLRAGFSPGEQPPWIDVSGADPYRIVPLHASGIDASGLLAVLRGSQALVRLDHELVERARLALPFSPTALCVDGDDVWVASRYDSRLLHAQVNRDGGLAMAATFEMVPGGIADLACGAGGPVYVLPADGSELLTLDHAGKRHGAFPALAGGLRLRRHGRYLLELSLFDRTLRVLSLSGSGAIVGELLRVRHDGTLWAFDALSRGSELWLALAGVEDKPLVRAHGEFENIDSFVWIYRLGGDQRKAAEALPQPTQVAELDVSDSGLVVPKAISLSEDGAGVRLSVLAAGSGRFLQARFPDAAPGKPELEVTSAPPGGADAVFSEAGRAAEYVSPLLDAFVSVNPRGVKVQHVDVARQPAPGVRLGEALFFTELMAPENSSQGTHSRFSCETCHFEGGVDGRTHYTGRAEVSVVTKPLFGLANNRPHFSRAMDPDLSSVSHNEFRVAGAGSGTDPWFSLESARFPWLAQLGIERATSSPLELREDLLEFLYAFSHAPNPRSQGRRSFSQLERQGAEAFRDHCQSCHRARLSTDDPQSEVPFAAWEARIFSRNAPLVWASPDHERVGVLPYVHERGTRVTSLRRLSLKPRYFTNGSAPDLASVLARFKETSRGALHDAPPETAGDALPSEQQRALLAFLLLL